MNLPIGRGRFRRDRGLRSTSAAEHVEHRYRLPRRRAPRRGRCPESSSSRASAARAIAWGSARACAGAPHGRASCSPSSLSSSRSGGRAEPILPLSLFRNRIFHRRERDRVRRRPRALRRRHVPAAVPPGGTKGLSPTSSGLHDDADDGRRARHLGAEREPDQPLGALPPVPDRRHGARHGRDAPARPARGGHERAGTRVADMLGRRPRAGDDDAGARLLQCRTPSKVQAARRGDVRLDPLPLDRRLDRGRRCSGRSSPTASPSSFRRSPPAGRIPPRRGPALPPSRSCPRRRTRRTWTRSRQRCSRCSSPPRASPRSRSCSRGCSREVPLRTRSETD